MSSQVVVGVSTTVSRNAEGLDLVIAYRKLFMETASEFKTSASI